jgi:hypothetical protein
LAEQSWLNNPGRPLWERMGRAVNFMREALQVGLG